MNYKDLTVWQKAMDLVSEVYRLVKKLPEEEKYALANQMRRSAVSIPSNIAEGKGRKTDNEFKNFLGIANGSLMELETQLLICIRLKYVDESETHLAFSLLDEVNRMITTLMLKI